ncbi:hypothetical protein B4U79_07710 [Dinothrombium tinctorium]|uniref:Peptidase S1 domain-containing protein n=1 Tax=Dinothrombium tinctorium TaxID=1965070 RepID=A0A443RER5_9ACAR|nr:hypothetical protein B4U79_07710 [Dinothrombium tinctorium]
MHLKCGVTEPSKILKVEGGYPVAEGKHPWAAAVDFHYEDGRVSFCGGSILNNRHVLTAAHCFKGKVKKIEVTIGTQDLIRGLKASIDVESFLIHENYVGPRSDYILNEEEMKNDIALLKLAIPIAFSRKVKPICLPPFRSLAEYPRLVFIGWGLTKAYGKHRSPVLQETVSREIPLVFCQHWWSNKLWHKQLCANGDGRTDTRRGDSGSPVIYESKLTRRSYIVGIVSFGHKFDLSIPSVYTRVSECLDWIYANTRDADYCTE